MAKEITPIMERFIPILDKFAPSVQIVRKFNANQPITLCLNTLTIIATVLCLIQCRSLID